jgi:hypothetical protein
MALFETAVVRLIADRLIANSYSTKKTHLIADRLVAATSYSSNIL